MNKSQETRLRVLKIQYESLTSESQKLGRKYEALRNQQERIKVDEIAKKKTAEGLKEFCQYYLGIELTPDQFLYEKNSAGKWIRVNRSGNKWGKGLRLNEKILTPRKWKLAGEIKVGDTVYSEDGKETKITGVYPQGIKKCYRMIFDDGSSLTVDNTHLWTCQTATNRFRKESPRYKKWEVLSTGEILKRWGVKPKKKNRITIPVTKPVQFEKQKLEIDPYQLGLLLGDGCMSQNCEPKFTTEDLELIKNFPEYKKKNKYDYQVYGFRYKLRKLNLLGTKSNNKFIPKKYLWNSVENRIAILQGLMDTDGNIETHYGKTEYCAISKQLADDVKFIVQSLGGKAVINSRYTFFTYKGKKKRGQKSYRVRIRIPDVCPFRLKRKKERWGNKQRTNNRILIEIKEVEDAETVCFSVASKYKTYLATDFIVTHNTFFEALGIIWEAYYKLDVETDDPLAWLKTEYLQGVAAPEYSGSRTLLNELIKICEGKILLPDGNVNASKLKGWFIKRTRGIESDSTQPPVIKFFNNSELWGRSYSGLGASMKQKTFHRIIIDEAGDIPELHKFIFATLVPRTTMSRTGLIAIIGTPQGYKFDYSLVIQELEDDDDAYVHQASTKENIYITPEALTRLTKAYKHDPILMMQVLHGEMVEVGGAVIPGDVVDHAIDLTLPMRQGALRGHRYVGGIDSAMKTDENAITIIDVTTQPFKVVKQFGISAKHLPPETFYAEIISLQREYNSAYFLFDASGFGGQIMRAALLEKSMDILFASIVGTKTRPEREQINKGDLIVNVREMMTAGRDKQVFYDKDGTISEIIEENDDYGLVRTPNHNDLIQQTKVFQWDDKNLITDKFISFALALWLAKQRIRTRVDFALRTRR